jgi:hypothetical protein
MPVAKILHLGIGDLPWEYVEMRLCRDVYHCLPSELDREDWGRVRMHMAMMEAETKVPR